MLKFEYIKTVIQRAKQSSLFKIVAFAIVLFIVLGNFATNYKNALGEGQNFYFTNAVDANFGNLNNWFLEDSFGIPADGLPTEQDNVFIYGDIDLYSSFLPGEEFVPVELEEVSVANFTMYGDYTMNMLLRVSNRATFNHESKNTAGVYGDSVVFNNDSYNQARVSANNVTFNGNSYYLSGVFRLFDEWVEGYPVIIFNGNSSNQGESLVGSPVFNHSSRNNGVINNTELGMVRFHGGSSNDGTVYGDACFVDGSTNNGEVQGTTSSCLPYIVELLPEDGEELADINSSLKITFSEDVEVWDGSIYIYKGDEVFQEISVSGEGVTVSGNIVTVNNYQLEEGSAYYVLIDSEAFMSSEYRLFFSGIEDSETWNFSTGIEETRTLYVVSLSPEDNSVGVSLDSNLVINFSQGAIAQTGNITIRKVSDNSVFETIPVGGDNVSGSGTSTITINPEVDFAENTAYYIEISPNSFFSEQFPVEGQNGYFAGITNSTAWNFTTLTSGGGGAPSDTTPPSISSLSPLDDSVGVALGTNLFIYFSEAVVSRSGNITIFKASDDSVVEAIDVAGVQVSGSGTSAIVINPTSNFNENTAYYIKIGSSAFEDVSGNPFAGINNKTSWNFVTEEIIGGSSGGSGSRPTSVCNDGLDNDNDGLIDFPEDPGCSSYLDDDEIDEVNPPTDPDPCVVDPLSCVTPPLVDPCILNPGSCAVLGGNGNNNEIKNPTNPCVLDPSSCGVNPTKPVDPCALNPGSCSVGPIKPIDGCVGDCSVPVEKQNQNVLEKIKTWLISNLTPQHEPKETPTQQTQSEPQKNQINQVDFCSGGILKSATCIVKESFDDTKQVLGVTLIQIAEIIDSPTGDILTKVIPITGLVFGFLFTVLPILFANTLSFSEIVLIPVRLWSLLMTVFGLRKKTRKWGVVYDSVTKRPLDPVHLILQDSEGKEVATAFTDIDGRYGFMVEPGKYRILPKKTHYTFPSLKVVGKTRDEIYLDLYFGYVFEVKVSGEVIAKNIPMDPESFDWNEYAKKEKELTKFFTDKELRLNKIADITFSVGIAIAFIALVSAATFYNIAIFALYLILLVIREFGVIQKKSSRVKRKGTDIPLAFAIVRVFDFKNNVEITNKITNQTGKVFLLVRNGEYYVTIENKNEDGGYAKVYTSDKIEVRGGILHKTFEV